MNRDRVYVLADPFARADSGVSSYIANSMDILHRNGIQAMVLPRRPEESIWFYRQRLSRAIVSASRTYGSVIVEAPESDAVTAEIPSGVAEIHIRLHCSRQLGAFLQGKTVDKKCHELEQREINRASLLSAPSRSAVIFSHLLFNLPNNICYYPNPAPCWDGRMKKPGLGTRSDVLFVGRFHPLKGAHWIQELARRLPEIKFLMVGPGNNRDNIDPAPQNLDFMDASSWNKCDVYANSKLVIIPSLYETASMVGIEALTSGTSVITWSHLGIAEYATTPQMTLVEPWLFEDFSDAIRSLVAAPKPSESGLLVGKKLNSLYLKGIRNVLKGEFGNFMPVAPSVESLERIAGSFNDPRRGNAMELYHTEPSWRRKLQKLRRDPVLFFKDAWWMRTFWGGGGYEKTLEDRKSVNELGVQPTPTSSEIYASIKCGEKISFAGGNIDSKANVCAFFYEEGRDVDAQEIIRGLSDFHDFRYVQPPHLKIGTFSTLQGTTAIELINNIDHANKKRISSIDYIILLDPPPILVQALRCCGPRQRTIVIVDKLHDILPDPWHTDVLVVVGDDHHSTEMQYWRRKIVAHEGGHVPSAIRRAIQEGVPKVPNMLIPLLGFNGNHRKELLELDVNFHQGIIKGVPKNPSKGSTMIDICKDLAHVMTDLAVTESVYLRYRSLCDSVENVSVREKFLVFAMFDGVIFDVRA